MALLQNNLDQGLAAGAAITSANSANNGAGDAFTVSTSGTGTLTAQPGAFSGTNCMQVSSTGNGNAAYVEWAVTSGNTHSVRLYYKHSTSSYYYGHIYAPVNSSGLNPILARISNDSLVINDLNGSLWTGYWTGSAHPTLTVGTWYRIELQMTVNPSSSTGGLVKCDLFEGNSATPVAQLSASGRKLNTDPITAHRFGRHKTDQTSHTYLMDDIATEDTITWIGPSAAATTTSTTTTTTTAAPTTTTSTTTSTTTAGTTTSTTTSTTTAAPTTTTTTTTSTTTTTTTVWNQLAPTLNLAATDIYVPQGLPGDITWTDGDADTIPYNGAHWNIGAVNGGFGFGGMFANYTPAASHVTIRVDILHTSGTFSGAGLRLSTAETRCWDFHETIDAPSPGTYYRLTKTLPASTLSPYFFANYGGSASPFFSPVTAKEMTVYGLHIRDATAAEIATPVDLFEVIDRTQVGRNESFGAQNSNADFSNWTGATPEGTAGWSDGPDKVSPQTITRTVSRISGPGQAPALSAIDDNTRRGTWEEPGTHVYRIAVTDSENNTTEAFLNVHITAPIVKANSVVTNPDGWEPHGLATITGCLADDEDSTYVTSPGAQAETTLVLAFPPLGVGAIVVNTRDGALPGSSITRTYKVMEGNTTIATRVISPLPTDPVSYSWELTDLELGSITDRSQLRLSVTDRAL